VRALAAFQLLNQISYASALDIGSGDGLHARLFREAGKHVTTISMIEPADIVGDYLAIDLERQFDVAWASHVLEHQVNPGHFLEKVRRDLKSGGILAVTVPPMKPQMVGGHVSLWNAGLLLYHLVLAGIDCADAKVWSEGYDVSVIVRNKAASLPADLIHDAGDLERLAHLFPLPVKQGFSGEIHKLNWHP
jgi:SAM-dependent methyltransferase